MPRAAACLVTLMLAAAVRPDAHHSVLGFDVTRALTLRGVVDEVLWNNPHTYIAVIVKSGARHGQRWLIESESPIALRRLGWSRESVRVGDRVSTTGAPDRRGQAIMRCQSVTVEGHATLPCYPATTQ
jgi:hypothetical protein